MYSLGHVTNNDEARALYYAYDIPYRVMKRTGEVRAQKSGGDRDFKDAVKRMLCDIGAGCLLENLDIWDSENGYVFISSLSGGSLTEELKSNVERNGYSIENSGFKLYKGLEAFVIRRKW